MVDNHSLYVQQITMGEELCFLIVQIETDLGDQ